jgi:hypothetical protein
MSNFATLKKSSSSLDRLTKKSKSSTPLHLARARAMIASGSLSVISLVTVLPLSVFFPLWLLTGDAGIPWTRYFDHGFQGTELVSGTSKLSDFS